MSQPSIQQRIRQHPKFAELVARRTRFALVLSLVVLVPYYSFMMIVAFNPLSLGAAISEGSMVTVGVAAELFMFIFFWVLTAVYVKRANTEFDALTAEIIQEAWKGEKQ